jgi:hypothetical protein
MRPSSAALGVAGRPASSRVSPLRIFSKSFFQTRNVMLHRLDVFHAKRGEFTGHRASSCIPAHLLLPHATYPFWILMLDLFH